MAEEGDRFPASRRLLRSADFKRVFEHPCRVSNEGMTLLARPNGLDHPRLGLAIPKRQIKRAVARNRIKRQVRESFRLHQLELGGIDIVVIAKAAAGKWPRSRLRLALDSAWSALQKRCENSLSF